MLPFQATGIVFRSRRHLHYSHSHLGHSPMRLECRMFLPTSLGCHGFFEVLASPLSCWRWELMWALTSMDWRLPRWRWCHSSLADGPAWVRSSDPQGHATQAPTWLDARNGWCSCSSVGPPASSGGESRKLKLASMKRSSVGTDLQGRNIESGELFYF